MKGEKTTTKTMVSSVTVLVLLLLVSWAAVQAQQVLSNSEMEECATFNYYGFLTDWSGDYGVGLDFPVSYVPSSAYSLDEDTCAAIWTVESTPYTQTLNLDPVNGAPGLYDFAARFACATTDDPGTCTFSLTIGGQLISLTGTFFKTTSSNTDTYETLTADNILITDPNAEVVFTCDVTGPNDNALCFVTQATLTFDSLAVGDPHFVGLNGQRFDIQGESGSAFNILSDFDVQVNCLLGRQQVGEHSFTSGPVMMTIAILTSTHTILANAGGSSISDSGFVSVDGVKVGEGEKVVTEDGVSVSFEKVNRNAKDLGLGSDDHIAAISHVEIKGSYKFTLFFVENGRDRLLPDVWLTKFARRFLDLSVSLLDDSRAPHGILGQTHIRGEDKKRSIKDWKMEGTEDDYRLSDGVLGSDFAFNKFRV